MVKKKTKSIWGKLILIITFSLFILVSQETPANAQPDVRFEVDPSQTALIVVDMQNDFVREGAPGYVPDAKKTIENLEKLINVCRGGKIPVVYTKFIMPPVKTVYRQYYWRVAEKNMCVKGFKRYYADVKKELETTDIIDELYPKPEDLVIEKYWLDSFVDTPLNTFLQVLGAKYLIITGTVTDACVSATVMGAWHRSYHVVVVTDAISGVVQERNECTLKLLPVRYGKLMTTSEVIGKLKR